MVENIRALDLIPVSQKEMVRMLMPTLPELIRYGRYASELGYPSESVFEFHGKKHILRVLLLGLKMCIRDRTNAALRMKVFSCGQITYRC